MKKHNGIREIIIDKTFSGSEHASTAVQHSVPEFLYKYKKKHRTYIYYYTYTFDFFFLSIGMTVCTYVVVLENRNCPSL